MVQEKQLEGMKFTLCSGGFIEEGDRGEDEGAL